MKHRTLFYWLTLLIILALASACSSSETSVPEAVDPTATTPPPTATTPPTEEAASSRVSTEAGGACQNPYYPLRSDTTWTYRIFTDSDPNLGSYQLSYENITADSFDAIMSLEDPETGEIFNASATWLCSPDGIISTDFAQINITQLADINYETLEYEGVFLPPAEDWVIGTTWDSRYQITTDFTMEGISVETDLDIQINSTITAVEEVTVTAGTFPESYRVDSVGTISVDLGGDLSSSLSDIPLEYSTWFVENVGMVKQVSSSMDGFAGAAAEGGNSELISIE